MAGDFPATFDFPTMTSDYRLSDYDQRLSRSEVSDFGWRLSDYDRPPSFRVEVRRFSDLLTGWRGWRLPGLADLAAGLIESRCRECAEKCSFSYIKIYQEKT